MFKIVLALIVLLPFASRAKNCISHADTASFADTAPQYGNNLLFLHNSPYQTILNFNDSYVIDSTITRGEKIVIYGHKN